MSVYSESPQYAATHIYIGENLDVMENVKTTFNITKT